MASALQSACNSALISALETVNPDELLATYLRSLGTLDLWWAAISDAFFTFSSGAQINDWVTRAALDPTLGALGAQILRQGTTANQPLRILANPLMGGQNSVRYDGVTDFLAIVTSSIMKMLHDGSRSAMFFGLRVDSTGGAIGDLIRSANTVATIGVRYVLNATSFNFTVYNGSGSTLNSWTGFDLPHYARDVTRCQMIGYDGDALHSRVAGSALSNADAVGQSPSTANPTNAMLVASGNNALKVDITDIIVLRELPSIEVSNNIIALVNRKLAA